MAIPDIINPIHDLRGFILGLREPIRSMIGLNLCLRGPKRYETAHPRCERYDRRLQKGFWMSVEVWESILVLPASLARLNGLQNPYLLLEYSSVTRAIEQLFVGRWPEGPAGLKRVAMAPLARPSVYATHDSCTRGHLDYCAFYERHRL